ncbi:quinone oxidoreductase-like protein 2 isoform X2 [Coturnix japonica]|uniref:quinone oxidoreductase-like protein 2 isoform X2 n=1 Tax=Coturnix japonica TaxID=93934 RepID=UPI00077720D9|nr:quinone oxidoreductase-like protein 2 isoform X2 [Coturnix japonica]
MEMDGGCIAPSRARSAAHPLTRHGHDAAGPARYRRALTPPSWPVPIAAQLGPAPPRAGGTRGPEGCGSGMAAAVGLRLCTLRLPAQHGARGYRAALCTQLAQPLLVQDLPAPRLQPHQVRVSVHYCGLNFADILACQGLYQEKHALPFTPGMEFSGTVKETGENVSAVKEGQRVIGATGVSAMAEECIVDEKVIAAAGSDPKCQLVLENGASHAVNYSQNSLREQVAALTGGRGVDVAIEAVGGDIFKAALRSLVWEGRIVVMGFAGGKIPSIPANLLLLKNVSAMGVYWGRYQQEDFPLFSSAMSSLLQYCQEGKIHPRIGAVFKLEEVNEAFNHVLQRKSTGKVIISMK